jgi:hypothetical protein
MPLWRNMVVPGGGPTMLGRKDRLMRYWIYLGSEPEAGPFPTYGEAHREREFLVAGRLAGTLPSIFKIRTDEFDRAHPISATKPARSDIAANSAQRNRHAE